MLSKILLLNVYVWCGCSVACREGEGAVNQPTAQETQGAALTMTVIIIIICSSNSITIIIDLLDYSSTARNTAGHSREQHGNA